MMIMVCRLHHSWINVFHSSMSSIGPRNRVRSEPLTSRSPARSFLIDRIVLSCRVRAPISRRRYPPALPLVTPVHAQRTQCRPLYHTATALMTKAPSRMLMRAESKVDDTQF